METNHNYEGQVPNIKDCCTFQEFRDKVNDFFNQEYFNHVQFDIMRLPFHEIIECDEYDDDDEYDDEEDDCNEGVEDISEIDRKERNLYRNTMISQIESLEPGYMLDPIPLLIRVIFKPQQAEIDGDLFDKIIETLPQTGFTHLMGIDSDELAWIFEGSLQLDELYRRNN